MQIATYHRLKRGKDTTCSFFLQYAKPNYEVFIHLFGFKILIECMYLYYACRTHFYGMLRWC